MFYVEDKLSALENEYKEKKKLVELEKNQMLKERLMAMEKKYELQKKKDLEQEVCWLICFIYFRWYYAFITSPTSIRPLI